MGILASELRLVKGLERAEWEKWADVKTEEEFWGDVRKETQQAIKMLIESSMEVQVNDLIGSRCWEQNPYRVTYRNGRYKRTLLTSYGYLCDIKVPRVRDGKVARGIKRVIPRYKRRASEIDKTILEMFLGGVSTRRVEEVLAPLLDRGSVSATTVSTITKRLDGLVTSYHNRRLEDEYKYVIFDGINVNTKSPVYKVRRVVLVAYGIKGDGKREIIDFQLAKHGESENAWQSFLNSLYWRGLKGEKLKMAVIDGNKGLRSALDFVYPTVLIQRCWVHKMRNVAKRLPEKVREECISEARSIYSQEEYNDAVYSFKKWAYKWRQIVPDAVKCIEEDLEELLNFYKQPFQLWKKLRTTNIIERVFREVRRRTRPMSCFNNRESVERIIFAILTRQNKLWEGKPLIKNFSKLTQFS